jgi:hypothetical protein
VWSVVRGPWSMVHGPWSIVHRPSSIEVAARGESGALNRVGLKWERGFCGNRRARRGFAPSGERSFGGQVKKALFLEGGAAGNFLLRRLGKRRSPLGLLRRESLTRPQTPTIGNCDKDGWDGLERRRARANQTLSGGWRAESLSPPGADQHLVRRFPPDPRPQLNPTRFGAMDSPPRDGSRRTMDHGPWTQFHGLRTTDGLIQHPVHRRVPLDDAHVIARLDERDALDENFRIVRARFCGPPVDT